MQTRKTFIKTTSLGLGALAIASRLGAHREQISCAPATKLTGTVTSVKDGLWSDFATWAGAQPMAGDTVAVNHAVKYDLNIGTFAGVNINGSLVFDPTKSCQLDSTKNIQVQGKLEMTPAAASIVHEIGFVGVDESNFVGGGMDPIVSDVGLWVMGSGKLNLTGSAKRAWTKATGSLAANSTAIAVLDATGWQIGDEVIITPTEENNFDGVELKTITGISGNTVTVQWGLSKARLQIFNKWTAEVANVSRNVIIGGTASGRSHIFIRSTQPQTIKNVQINYMGVRKVVNGHNNLVPGRYGLHFHHCVEGSRGSVVDGCVVRDTNSHAFVPHVSNGITMRNNVTYNTYETAFWWDVKTMSHDTQWIGNLVALCKYVPGAIDMDSEEGTGVNDPIFASQGFLLGPGDGNVCNDNVVTCTGGENTANVQGSAGGFTWEADNEGVWTFKNNLCHNNIVGIRVWQNTVRNHVLENTDMYHNAVGAGHGAYGNAYTYRGGTWFKSYFNCHASAIDTKRVRLEKITFEGAGTEPYGVVVISSQLPGTSPIFIRGCSFNNFITAGIVEAASGLLKNVDVIQCTSNGTLALMHATATAQEVMRVQPLSGQTVRITKAGTTNIAKFAAQTWGDGLGLLGQYYPNATLTGTPVVERVDSVVDFPDWGTTGPYYKITALPYSVRWAGKLLPQFTEAHTFRVKVAGGIRLWVNGVKLADVWQELSETEANAGTINLTAGQAVDIKLEYLNTDSNSQVALMWFSNSLPTEIIPQSQLYAPGPYVPPVIQPDQNTIALTCTPNPATVAQNWNLKAVSTIGGVIDVNFTDAAGAVMATGQVQSGQMLTTGAGVAVGTYTYTAKQGSVTNAVQIKKV